MEDLHWAEDPLLDLLDRVCHEVRGPLLVIGTARPELLDRRRSWGGGRRNASLVWLDALSPGEAAEMLDELVPGELSGETRAGLVERAEGNPFFLEELLAAVVETGTVVEELPDSVQAILSARVDTLASGDKSALQAASVIGRVFWSGPTLELVGGGPVAWTVLEDRDFIRRRSTSSIGGETEYTFKHALTREVVYGSVPKARRARLHALIAAWLERTGSGRDEDAALLAHHYAQAANPEDADLAWADEPEELERLRVRALGWLRRAAELAIRRYDLDEGIANLQRALELCEPHERSELWREIGGASALKFDGERFWEAMKRALKLTDDPEVQADILADLAVQTSIRSGMWPLRPDTEEVEGWIRQALELARPDSAAYARALIARAYWNPAEEQAAAREGSALAEQVGDLALRSFAWGARASAAFAAARLRTILRLGAPTGRPAARDRRPRPPDRDLRGADPVLRADRPLSGGAATRRGARGALTAAHPASPHPHNRDRARGEGADGGVEGDPGAQAGRRASRRREPRHAVHPELALLARDAVAHAYEGEHDTARRLEERALEIAFEGFGFRLFGPRVRLALLRNELDVVEEMIDQDVPRRGHDWMVTSATVWTRLDGLLAHRTA